MKKEFNGTVILVS